MCGVHAIGDDANVLASKIILEERRGALGDGRKRNFRVRVNPPLQSSQESVVDTPMEPPKKTGPCGIAILFVCKFLEAMEKRVNDDNIGVQTVDSGRKNEVEAKSMDPPIPCARDRIQK
jgi:hypothetical protein